jgi:lipopolysaccharide biosynthesis glycosyltransferase
MTFSKVALAATFLALLLMWYGNFQATRIVQDHMTTGLTHTIGSRYSGGTRIRPNTDHVKQEQQHEGDHHHELLVDRMSYDDQTNQQTQTQKSRYVAELSTTEKTATKDGRGPFSPYAYAWIMGGVHEDRFAYKGFLWTILISANLLRRLGSTADFWVYVRLSSQSKLSDLPSEDRRLLELLGVHVILLDKPKRDSFAQIVYDKFLTINMTSYKRVIFLDSDIIPMTNLDYFFHLSDPDYTLLPTLLKPFFIMATREEPCNTGMFMVEPSKHAFQEYINIVNLQKEKAKTLPYPYFDFQNGWGHSFDHGDYWESIRKKGNRWKFHASHSDQGLMYYFVKYVQKEVSIAIGDRIQNWKKGLGDVPEMESDTHGVLAKYQGNLLRVQYLCDISPQEAFKRDADDNRWACTPPYNSIAHFMGKTKPWRRKFDFRREKDDSYRQFGPRYLWFKELDELSKTLDMGLDVKRWNQKYLSLMKDELLGGKAEWKDQADVLGIHVHNTIQ